MQDKLPDGEDLKKLLVEISEIRMPFGMYGPAKYPPKGCLIMDIPEEYLTWFKANGFPKGKLGYLMEQCWFLRANGLDSLFDPFRRANGGRTTKKVRRKTYDFGE
ncbi:MAG: DUF3820 family protein [Akkermansia sp.]